MSTEASDSPAVDAAHFRQVLGHFPTGITVITATATQGGPVGLAVGSFFSVSLEPPLVGFCAAKTSSTLPQIQAAGHFAVNVLADDQEAVCRMFATKGTDKFAGLSHKPAPGTGAPILSDVLAWIDCEVDTLHEGGDHWIVVGRVTDLAVVREGAPLVFFRGGYGCFTSG